MTVGDYDLRGNDIDQRFSRFCLRPLSDADVWALAMATMVMPDGNPGAEGYLAQVSGTTLFAGRLTIWGRVVALGVAQGGYKAPNGRRRRAYVEGYDESWGRYAVADGLTLALYGTVEAGIVERCDKLGCGKQAYQRIRDFVGGALLDAIAEFRVALEWATGSRRDRVLEGRWEAISGVSWDKARADAIMGRETEVFVPRHVSGCCVTPKAPGLDDYDRSSGIARTPRLVEIEEETLYYGLRPTEWWDETVTETPVKTIYPGHGP